MARASIRIVLACMTALAGTATEMPAAHASAAHNWRGYVMAPASQNVEPARASVLSGDVRNPHGVIGSNGVTTMTVAPGGAPATLLIDYGKEVVGTPYIDVKAYKGAATALQLTFSETREHLFTPGSSTLASDAPKGSRTIIVADASTFAAGDTVQIGSLTNRLVAVSSTTLTLAHKLHAAVPAGTAVTSTPGALTGDGVGAGGYSRPQSIALTAKPRLDGTFEGGFRFETITLSTPGTVVLDKAGLHFEAYRATPAKYQGHFLSNSDSLNTMWYDGAYTVQTDMQPAGVQGGLTPVVLDGAKRDRKIWSGDIAVEGRTILDSLGSNGANYVKQSLLALFDLSTPGSGLAGYGDPAGGSDGLDPAYSNTYSSWTVDDATTYFRATGDRAFARHALPYLEGQLSYDATLTNSAGLLVTANVFGGADSGLDWDIYDGPKAGVVASANMLYYRALTDVAYVENQLGNHNRAARYQKTADKLEQAINTNLFNPATGAYDLSETSRGVIAQDANSLALLFGIAPADKVADIVAALKSLWGPHGSAPYSADAHMSPLISPFVTGLEVEGLYQVGRATDAEQLLHLTWNQMINPRNPAYTGTFWENYLSDGTLADASISAAHGWGSAPTVALTDYVLGVQPVDAGYRTFTVSPHFGSLRWAEGTVPTPYGQIRVGWVRQGDRIDLTVQAPPGTTATVTFPGGRTATIHGTAETLTASAH